MLEFTQKVIENYKQELDTKVENNEQTYIKRMSKSNTQNEKSQLFKNQQSYLLSSQYYKQDELLRAEIFGEQEKFEETNDIYKNLISLSENQDSTPFYYLSYNLIQQSLNTDESIEFLKKALEINPKNSQMHHCLGLQYSHLKDFRKSKIHIEISLSLNNLNADCYHTFGKLLTSMKDFKGSKKVLLKSIKINPAYNGYFDFAYNYFAQKKYHKSIKYFKKEIIVNDTLNCYQNLGRLYEAIKDYKNSIYYYQKFLQISSNKKKISSEQHQLCGKQLLNLAEELVCQLKDDKFTTT